MSEEATVRSSEKASLPAGRQGSSEASRPNVAEFWAITLKCPHCKKSFLADMHCNAKGEVLLSCVCPRCKAEVRGKTTFEEMKRWCAALDKKKFKEDWTKRKKRRREK